MIFVRTPEGERTLEIEDFEQEVRQGQMRPSTLIRLPAVTGDRWIRAEDLELFTRIHQPAHIRFTRRFSLSRFPVVTALLCLAQVVIYLVVSGGARVVGIDALVEAGAKVGANVLELGESWRLLTANLLHRDVLHLGFNTFFLFNLGGPVENAYRGRDFVLILVASALGTTVTSLVLSPVPSVGASGVVLGLFGAASVFGYKYGELLPRRYRRYFGGAVLPYALFILYVGVATPDTDNWGHVGGLFAGAAVTGALTPRLLLSPRAERRWGSAVAAAGLALVALAIGPLVQGAWIGWAKIVDEGAGVRLERPARWTAGLDHLGQTAWGNRLGVSVALRADPPRDTPVTLDQLRAELFDEIEAREASGDIAEVRRRSERPFFVRGGRGLEVVVELESRAGPQRTRNLLIERGYHGYRLVMSSPARWADRYRPLFARLAASLQLIEPRALRSARRLAETFPGMSSAQAEWGAELARVGQGDAAVQAYQRALAALPGLPSAIQGLAALALHFGGDLVSAEAAMAELWAARPTPDRALLLADLRTRLGRRDAACDVLQPRLGQREPPSPPVRARLSRLRCPVVPWSE